MEGADTVQKGRSELHGDSGAQGRLLRRGDRVRTNPLSVGRWWCWSTHGAFS